jgi:hypothetical protein
LRRQQNWQLQRLLAIRVLWPPILFSNNMTPSNATYSTDAASTPIVPEFRPDLNAVMKQIRLCRSTLGAILDELECGDQSPGTIERLAERAIGVTGEIEELWETTKPSL